MAAKLAFVLSLCSLLLASVGQTLDAQQSRSSMDFWLGEWDVQTMDGRPAGKNRIEKTLDGAAIFEHWTADSGGEGKSLFYWMADKKKWKQVWVTASGEYKEKVAEPIKGGLLFTGRAYRPDGTSYPDRTRLTRQGDEVRQVIEVSRDEGKTWVVVWDSVYWRAKGH